MKAVNVYQKLNHARLKVHACPLKKSGKNPHLRMSYFELGDFMPAVLKVFNEIGLCGFVSYDKDVATLTIVDVETGAKIQITSPMGSASLKNCHEVQNIGAVETYQRRYLWLTALELLENDELDQEITKEEKQTITLSDDDVMGACVTMEECKSLSALQEVFGAHWKHSNDEQKKRLKAVYDRKKGEMQ